MAKTIFTITFWFLLKSALSQNNNERINEGASTSEDLSAYEECEIHNYAEAMGRLILAEDVNGGSLTDMMNNRFHELQAFHDQIYSYYALAEFGAQQINDQDVRLQRRRFYAGSLRETILFVLEQTASDHFYFKLSYEYSDETNMIVGTETVTRFDQDNCLCNNFEERMILSESFTPPAIQQPETAFQIFRNSSEVSVTEVSQYNIIPLSLISRFFQLWLSDSLEDIPETEINRCVYTLIGRLKRSILKLIIVQVRNVVSTEVWHSIDFNLGPSLGPNFFSEVFKRASNWLRGNIFFGPRNRGPLDPAFGRSEEELLMAFEYDAESIIGSEHHQYFKLLFNALRKFVKSFNEISPLDRLLNGFDLFNSMMFILMRRDATPLNIDQWELREPTNEELRRVTDPALRRLFRTQKFYTLRKKPHRNRRSIDYDFHDMAKVEKVKRVKHSWSVFIANLMRISIEAANRHETLPWSCDLTLLYYDYFVFKSENPLSCQSFSRFMFTKISVDVEWKKCNEELGLITTEDWCQAWKNIMKQPSIRATNLDYMVLTKPISKLYLQDVKRLMRWLSPKIELNKCKNGASKIIKPPGYFYVPPDKVKIVINALINSLTVLNVK